MRPRVTIQHEDINSNKPVRVLCTSVRPSGSKNNSARPTPNRFKKATVQTVSVEPLRFVLENVIITNDEGTLNYNHILSLYNSRFDGSNAAILKVRYGDGLELVGQLGEENIKVVLDSFNVPISVSDSKDAKINRGGSLVFTETRVDGDD